MGKPKGLPVRRDWSVNPAQSFTMFDSVVKGLQPILYEVIMTTSNAVSVFQFQPSFDVRVIVIDGNPWFVASDVAAALEYRDAANMTRFLDDDDKGTHNVSTPSGNQQMTIINESGLYSAILKSRKPEAKKFKKWVTSEVLPTIRKTGSYTIAKAAIETISPTQYHNLRVMVNDIADSFHFKGSWEHWAWRHIRALSNGEVAAKLPATMYDQAVTVLKALEVDASLFLSQQRDREKEFLRQDRTLLTQRVQMALPLQ